MSKQYCVYKHEIAGAVWKLAGLCEPMLDSVNLGGFCVKKGGGYVNSFNEKVR